MQLPDPLHRHVAYAQSLGKRPCGPVRLTSRPLLQRRIHYPLHDRCGYARLPSRTRRILAYSINTKERKPRAPSPNRDRVRIQLVYNLLVHPSLRCEKNDLRAKHQTLRSRSPPRPLLQLPPLLRRQNDCCCNAHDHVSRQTYIYLFLLQPTRLPDAVRVSTQGDQE